jgi:hypothetical protein
MSDLSHIYAKLHETRFEHVTRARRERDLETRVYELERLLREAMEWIVEGKVDFSYDLADRIDATLEQP